MKDYLDVCFKALIENNSEHIQNITLLKLCASHITKNMKRDIMQFFKNDDALFIASLLGGIFNLESFTDIDGYIKDFLAVLLCSHECNELTTALQRFSKFATLQDWPVDSQNELLETEFQQFQTIYKDSKFFQIYDQFIRKFQVKSKSAISNCYYKPKFVALVMKKYISFLPLWTLALSKLKSLKPKRANNGNIEGKILKLKYNFKISQ